mmetsp:Transcript_56256/g.171328  ORF Transcript_56256/g.171328 Transcript_56256/m.171328 type:complete len:217 (-) Transcript_56256:321-971(-)
MQSEAPGSANAGSPASASGPLSPSMSGPSGRVSGRAGEQAGKVLARRTLKPSSSVCSPSSLTSMNVFLTRQTTSAAVMNSSPMSQVSTLDAAVLAGDAAPSPSKLESFPPHSPPLPLLAGRSAVRLPSARQNKAPGSTKASDPGPSSPSMHGRGDCVLGHVGKQLKADLGDGRQRGNSMSSCMHRHPWPGATSPAGNGASPSAGAGTPACGGTLAR